MKLLYSSGYSHLGYEEKGKPWIEIKNILKNELWEIPVQENKIAIVSEGKLKFSCGDIVNNIITTGKIVLFPSGTKLSALAEQNTTITLFRLHQHFRLFDMYPLEWLLRKESITDKVDKQIFLDSNEILSVYVDALHKFINHGLRCALFFETKLKELFFLFGNSYNRKELSSFFFPLLANDTGFSDLVFHNYHKAKTVKDLAELTYYSVSGFEKRFKKVFHTPPSQWLKQQRAQNIFHEINHSKKTLKEISHDFGFTSPAHLNDFFKSHFGITPGKVRKQIPSPTDSGKKG